MNSEFSSDLTSFSPEANSPQKIKITCEYQECSKIFKSKKTLKDHLKIHKGEKPYSCDYSPCEKAFTQYSSFQKHKRTHSGEKPYQCQSCTQAFTQASNLKRHERIHNGEKPHQCHICLKLFVTTSNLKQHVQTHQETDARSKYKCTDCEKEYNYHSSLKKHAKTHQNGEAEAEGEEEEEEFIDININDGFIKQNLREINFLHDENIAIQPQLLHLPPPPIKLSSHHRHFHPHPHQNEEMFPLENIQQKAKYQVYHHDHMDILEDGQLQHLNEHGLIEEHQLQRSDQNPMGCKPLKEITHIPRLVEFISQYEGILKEKNIALSIEQIIGSCSALTCSKQISNNPQSPDIQPQSQLCDDTKIENTLDCDCAPVDKKEAKEECICLETQFLKHKHSDTCGHPKILHEDHYDYIVDGHLHYVHGNHCDDHGLIMVADEFCQA